MNIQSILVLYKQQLAYLTQLLENAKDKKVALISTRHEAFEVTVHKEEKLLLQVQETERQRNEVIADFIARNFPELLGKTTIKLSRILTGKIAPSDLVRLEGLESELRNIIGELKEENSSNLFLIQHMRNFYAETMQALMGKGVTTLLDRKV